MDMRYIVSKQATFHDILLTCFMSAVAHEDSNIAVPQSSTATFNNFKRFVFT